MLILYALNLLQMLLLYIFQNSIQLCEFLLKSQFFGVNLLLFHFELFAQRSIRLVDFMVFSLELSMLLLSSC